MCGAVRSRVCCQWRTWSVSAAAAAKKQQRPLQATTEGPRAPGRWGGQMRSSKATKRSHQPIGAWNERNEPGRESFDVNKRRAQQEGRVTGKRRKYLCPRSCAGPRAAGLAFISLRAETDRASRPFSRCIAQCSPTRAAVPVLPVALGCPLVPEVSDGVLGVPLIALAAELFADLNIALFLRCFAASRCLRCFGPRLSLQSRPDGFPGCRDCGTAGRDCRTLSDSQYTRTLVHSVRWRLSRVHVPQ